MGKTNPIFLKNRRLLIISCFISMSVFPITFTIANPILIKISENMETDIITIGYIFTFISVGFIIGAGTAGIICRFFHRNNVLKAVYFLQIISFLLIPLWNNLYGFYLSFLLLGFCASFISVQLSSIISEIYREQAGFYMNMLHMFMGLGAFLGPILSLLADKWNLGLMSTFYLASALCLFNFLFALFIWIPDSDEYTARKRADTSKINISNNPGSFGSIKARYGYLMIVLLMLSIIFSISSREVINYWMPTFLVLHRNFDSAVAGKLLSYFWLVSIAGRFVTGLLARIFKIERILFLQSILQFLVAIIAILINVKSLIFVFVLLIGFLNAGFFPSILAIGSQYYKKNKSMAISILTVSSGAGIFLATGLTSIVYKYFNLQAGLILVSSLVLIVSITMLLIYIIFKKEKISL